MYRNAWHNDDLLAVLTASAEENAPVRSLGGKEVPKFSTADLTSTVNGAVRLITLTYCFTAGTSWCRGSVNGAYCDNTYDDALFASDILSMTHHILGTGVMDNYERPPVKIICVGDSITAGAGTLSAWKYSLYEKLDTYMAVEFDVFAMMIGTNDSR